MCNLMDLLEWLQTVSTLQTKPKSTYKVFLLFVTPLQPGTDFTFNQMKHEKLTDFLFTTSNWLDTIVRMENNFKSIDREGISFVQSFIKSGIHFNVNI